MSNHNRRYDEDVKKNSSGYIDPTASAAITNADDDYERFLKLLSLIFKLCELTGFHIEGRIVLRDDKTGKIWR